MPSDARVIHPDPSSYRSRAHAYLWVAFALAVIVVVVGPVVIDRPRDPGLLTRQLTDLSHVVVFFAIGLVLYRVIAGHRWSDGSDGQAARSDRLSIVAYCLLSALLGVVAEASQLFVPGRTVSYLDVLRNFAGSALALGFYVLRTIGPARRLPAWIAVGAIIAAVSAPLAFGLAAYVKRDRAWPTVLSADSGAEGNAFLHPVDALLISTDDAERISSAEISSSIQVSPLQQGEYGLTVDELRPDWSMFAEVCVRAVGERDVLTVLSVSLGEARHFRYSSNLKTDVFVFVQDYC